MRESPELLTSAAAAFKSPPLAKPRLPSPALLRPPRLERVLHVINGEHYAGAERVQDLLGSGMPEFGYEIDFVCLKPGEFPHRRRCENARVFAAEMSHRLDMRPALAIAQHMREIRYRAIHTHTPRSVLIGRAAALMAGVPLVHHVHSPTIRDSTSPLTNLLNATSERFCLIGAARLIAVSGSLGDHLGEQGYPPERFTVIPNGVPAIELPASEPRTAFTIGIVALFRPRKGIEILLDAAACLHREGLPVRIRAIGGFETPEYEANVRAHAEQLGLTPHVDWVGFTQDVPAELARIDALALPSLFGEGLPMVLLEAMSAGLPIVATRVEGVPEAIRDGQEGLLAAAGDPLDLADRLAELARDRERASALGAAARRRHREQFSESAMCAAVAQVYQTLGRVAQ